MTGELNAEAAIQKVWSVPYNAWVRTDFPAGFERAGIVTSPGFLNTFNTFRGRTRILSQRLLCHDVDETLNPDNFKSFVNPSLTQADRDHGEKAGCSYCHYGMDNQASALLGYHIDGTAQYDYTPIPSQLGHVFGQDGQGPAFLVKGFVERAAGFNDCMASSSFTALTGLHWEKALTDEERTAFEASAQQGPHALIQAILRSPLLKTGS